MTSGAFEEVVQEALARGVSVRFMARGSSMHPAIRDGETIEASPVRMSDVVRGDILLCRCHGRLLAHRVVAVIEAGDVRIVRTRGDAKAGWDAPLAPDDVIGRVTTVVRGPHRIRLDGRAARMRHRVRAIADDTRRGIGLALSMLSRRATIWAP